MTLFCIVTHPFTRMVFLNGLSYVKAEMLCQIRFFVYVVLVGFMCFSECTTVSPVKGAGNYLL